jgi:Ser/Thr protein kinase RdoA (MazF antagonist)
VNPAGPPDPGAVATIFALPGSRPRLTGPVAQGYMGRIWRLETEAGRWAIKEANAPLDLGHARSATAFELAAVAAGVPMPLPVPGADGDPVQLVDGRELRCHTWVEMAELDTDLDPTQLGALLARLHGVDFDLPGSADPWYSAPVGAARWDELLAACRDRAPFADRLTALRDDLIAAEAVIRQAPSLRTCHRDLFADNVRASGDGLCVVDWENCGQADPAGELGMVLFEFTRTDPARTQELYRAYLDSGGPARVTGPETFGMVVAVLHHIGEIGIRGWLAADDAGDDAGRTLNLGRVQEFVDDPLTPALIEAMVDATR